MKFSGGSGKNARHDEKKNLLVIYAESKRYWNIFKPLLDEFEKREQKITYLTGSKDDPVFKEKYQYITPEFLGDGNKVFSKLNLLYASVVNTKHAVHRNVIRVVRDIDVAIYIFRTFPLKDIKAWSSGKDHGSVQKIKF